MSSKFLTCLAAAFALGLALSAPSAYAEGGLAKADVESIVRDYIQAHPEEILDAVQSYQEKSMRADQARAVASNRVQLYNDDLTPTVGNADGDVTLVEFFDYNCGYCKKVLPQILELIKEDKNLRVLFKEYPILGPTSETAAKWALAAHKQGKYFEFHKALMENHLPIDDSVLEAVAKQAGLDVARAKADSSSVDVAAQLKRNRTLGANMNLRGTPAFIVGEQVAPGAVDTDELRRLISDERAKKQKK